MTVLKLILLVWSIYFSFVEKDIVEAVCDRTSTDCQDSCSAGQYHTESGCTTCPAGYYCVGGTGGPKVACSAGTYNANTGQSSSGACKLCGGTDISAAGSSACVSCPAGYSCTQPNTQSACSSGQYSLRGEMSCSSCPTGNYCPNTNIAPQTCSVGYEPNVGQSGCDTCTHGTYSRDGRDCVTCPKGNACAGTGLSAPIACADGTYQTDTGQSICTNCPAGSQCADKTASPITCSSGFCSSARSITCSACATDPGSTQQNRSYSLVYGLVTLLVCFTGCILF